MPSYAQRFFCTNTKQSSPALPAQVYDLTEAGAVVGAATTLTWSANAQSFRRVNPYANNAATTAPPATGGAASNFGWRLRRADSDAQGDSERFIAAGTWSVNIAITTGAYALLAANPNYSATAVIYRVSPTGTLTEMGRATAAARTVAANTQHDLTATVDLPEVVLAPGETLQVECYVQGQATANLLNQVTNNVVTVRTAQSYVDPGSPLRTRFTRSVAEDVPGVGQSAARVLAVVRAAVQALAVVEAAQRELAAVRLPSEPLTLQDAAVSTEVYPRLAAASQAVLDGAARVLGLVRGTTTSQQATDAAQRTGTSLRRTVDQLQAISDTATKQITYGRRTAEYFQPTDPPVDDPTRSISGVVRRASDGQPYLDVATLVLVRDRDGLQVATTTSSPIDGSYSFPRNRLDPETYSVRAFDADEGQSYLQDSTKTGLVPV